MLSELLTIRSRMSPDQSNGFAGCCGEELSLALLSCSPRCGFPQRPLSRLCTSLLEAEVRPVGQQRSRGEPRRAADCHRWRNEAPAQWAQWKVCTVCLHWAARTAWASSVVSNSHTLTTLYFLPQQPKSIALLGSVQLLHRIRKTGAATQRWLCCLKCARH